MTDEEKLLRMFKIVHGEMTGACYTGLKYNDEGALTGVHCMKHGQICWTSTKEDLVFDYVTQNWKESSETEKTSYQYRDSST